MLLKRLIQPTVTQNKEDHFYRVNPTKRLQLKSLLSAPLAGGGVFGLECHKHLLNHSMVFFTPSYFKWEDERCDRDKVFEELDHLEKESDAFEVCLVRPSMFPLYLDQTASFWQAFMSYCPKHISCIYQVLAVYRQDQWKERMEEQYQDYLEGIDTPSDSSFIRKVQRKVNNQLNHLLEYTIQYAPINEIEQKLKQQGFRCTIRFALYGGTKKERKALIKKIKQLLSSFQYLNQLTLNRISILELQEHKLSFASKSQTLCESELLPFLQVEDVTYTQPAIAEKKEDIPEKNSPFALLPLGEKIKITDEKEVALQFANALKEIMKIKEDISVKQVKSGPSITRLIADLPKSIRFSELIKQANIQDIQMYMGEQSISVTQGAIGGEIYVDIPRKEQQKIFLRNYIDTPAFIDYAKKVALPFFVGIDGIGEPLYRDLEEAVHLLIAGSTGSGKSVWLNQLIITLALCRTPEELQFIMIDMKNVELNCYEHFPHVQKMVRSADEAITVLQQLRKEVEKRYHLMGKMGVRKLSAYNKKAKEKIPYIVCVIDEYAELGMRSEGDCHDEIKSLAQLARAAGVHLIVATQRPSITNIPGDVKANLPSKIGFACATSSTYKTFLDSIPPYHLLGKGDGVMSFVGQQEGFIRFQGCLLVDDPKEEDKETELIVHIGKNMNGEKVVFDLPEVETEEEIKEPEINKVKRIIAQTGETRVQRLRDLMRINMNRMNKLMEDLAKEGWLKEPETNQKGYQINVDEEELDKWR